MEVWAAMKRCDVAEGGRRESGAREPGVIDRSGDREVEAGRGRQGEIWKGGMEGEEGIGRARWDARGGTKSPGQGEDVFGRARGEVRGERGCGGI